MKAVFFPVCSIFGACFVTGAFLAGIDMCMPGMFIWAFAGVETAASATALAAANCNIFTAILL
ncbi:MAG: hypothetical protein ACJ8FS_08870 [Sphingomicrobium sp.]